LGPPATLKATGTPGADCAEKWNNMVALQSIKQTGSTDDVVGVISFLASHDASYLTAQTVVVDGGLGRV
jgi:NAD(P)-dependent dehydrogenase (short-subunit alcohol dehydrogenase family)